MSVVRFNETKKRFMFDGRDKAGSRIQRFFRTEQEANKFKALFDADQIKPSLKGQAEISIIDAIKEYIEVTSPKKSERTVKQDKIYLQKFYDYLFERDVHYMDELTVRQIEVYQTHLLKDLAPSTVNREFVTLKHFFGKAYRWKYTAEDLSESVERIPEPPTTRKAWTNEDLEAFNTAVPVWVAEVLKAMDLTGLRPVQVGALRFCDVDHERGLYRSLSKKGGAWIDRWLPSTPEFFDLVQRRLEKAKRIFKGQPTDLVFLNSKNHPITADALGHAIRKVRGHLNLGDHTAYGLRHKYGTDLADLDIGIKKIATLMGHSRTTTTERYVHEKDSSLRDALNTRDNVRKLVRVK